MSNREIYLPDNWRDLEDENEFFENDPRVGGNLIRPATYANLGLIASIPVVYAMSLRGSHTQPMDEDSTHYTADELVQFLGPDPQDISSLNSAHSRSRTSSISSISTYGTNYSLGSKMLHQQKVAKTVTIQHASKYKSSPFTVPINLQGFKTIEVESAVGRLGVHHSFYNTKDELDNHRTLAQTNVIAQCGVGAKQALTEGVSSQTSTQAYANMFKTYIMKNIRTYDVQNNGNTTCSIALKVYTNKLDYSPTWQECLDDTTFERFQGTSTVWWYDGSAIQGTDNNSVGTEIGQTDLYFDPMKHRYKCRRNFTQLGKRKVILQPGESCRFCIAEIGPHLISSIYLDEYSPQSNQIKGYFRVVRFELRGIDVVSNNTNTQVSKAPASVAIIEKFQLKLVGNISMRPIYKKIVGDLPGSATHNTAETTMTFGDLPSFSNNVCTFINPQSEDKETGMDIAK